MKRIYKSILFIIILVFMCSLLAPAVAMTPLASARMSETLAQMVAERPKGTLRVIVQRASASDQAEHFVEKLGGQVLKDLPLIDAFAAQITAQAALELAQADAVRWVSLDAAVESAGKPPPKDSTPSDSRVSQQNVRDNFDKVAFDNNDGSQTWSTPWLEDDVLGQAATGGDVYVTDGSLRLSGTSGAGTYPGAARGVNLGHAMSEPHLTVNYQFSPGIDCSSNAVTTEISSDGGQTYHFLRRSCQSGGASSFTQNIAGYVSDQTMIRFRVAYGFDNPDIYFSIYSVDISYDANPLSSGPAYNTYLDTLGVQQVWNMGYNGDGIGVAVIDSGVSKEADFGRRIKKQISFNANSSTVNDTYGHGTHVAGIIGGEDADGGGRFTGIAPKVDLISLKINDENGIAYESDMVDAMQWVRDYKDRFNIRVVNLSVNSTVESSYHNSPVDAAAEILWLNGIVVVASAGNKGEGAGPNTANGAPANDPFIITVGASHEHYTTSRADDTVGSFSAFGTTVDGFVKPDIIAPGKDIISVLANSSPWYSDYTERVVQEEYFRISGTSMAAPIVTGAVALLLQAEPDLTPDQVKYRLLQTAATIPGSSSDPNTYPYLDVYTALTMPTSESANQGIVPHMLLAKMALIAYWSSENGEENIDWENVDWAAVNWNAVNWNAVNWNAVNWNAVNWNAINWNAVNWNAVNWNAVNWNAVNWNAVNWNSVNWNSVNWNSVNWNSLSWED